MYRSIVRILSMTVNCFKLLSLVRIYTFSDNESIGNMYYMYMYIKHRLARGYAPFIVDRCLVEINAIPSRGKWLYPPLSYYRHLCASHNTIVAIIAPVALSWMSVNSYYCALFLSRHCRLSFHNRGFYLFEGNKFIYSVYAHRFFPYEKFVQPTAAKSFSPYNIIKPRSIIKSLYITEKLPTCHHHQFI